MNGFCEAAAARLARGFCGGGLPEQRKVELYSNALEVKLYAEAPGEPAGPWSVPEIMDAFCAFQMLDAQLEAERPELNGLSLRGRFKALKPADRVESIVAQTYRVLKVIRRAAAAPGARFKIGERVVQVNYVENPFSFGLHITFTGLELLAALVATHLDMRRSPYPRAYEEALLTQYYEDAADQVRFLSDEDGNLVHFRRTLEFNRSCRQQCGNAHFTLGPERLEIDIPERFRDAARQPIDYFLCVEGVFHIIPGEALRDCGLAREELPRWAAREPDPGAGRPLYDLRLETETGDVDPSI